jgi:hypothetical protein
MHGHELEAELGARLDETVDERLDCALPSRMSEFGGISRAASAYIRATPAASPPLNAASQSRSPASTSCLAMIAPPRMVLPRRIPSRHGQRVSRGYPRFDRR